MKQAGFTLIELLIALAVVAILANVAAPSFNSLIDHHRGLVAAQELASGIRATRVAAITRNALVTIHAIEGDWSNGWRIVLDTGSKGADKNDTLLVERARSNQTRIVGNTRLAEQLSFNGLGGLVDRTNGTLHMCLKDQPASRYRVIVAPAGRVRIEDATRETRLCR